MNRNQAKLDPTAVNTVLVLVVFAALVVAAYYGVSHITDVLQVKFDNLQKTN